MLKTIIFTTIAAAIVSTIIVEAIKINLEKGFSLKTPKWVFTILNIVFSGGMAPLCMFAARLLGKKIIWHPVFIILSVVGAWGVSTLCGATIIKAVRGFIEGSLNKLAQGAKNNEEA